MHLPRSKPVRLCRSGPAQYSVAASGSTFQEFCSKKMYASERASNNSTGSGAFSVVSAEIEPVCLQGNMRISIVVPTLNEESHILGTIRSLHRLSREKEIIVVDGGTTDQTASLACAQNVLVLEAPQGRGIQIHVGALESTGISSVFFMLTPFLRHMPWSISVKVLKQGLQAVVISACCSMAHRVLPGSLLPSTR
jgi:cellulose synthase/poly-beta-1,6-N-acetylglucosamine synthase-like glycosyltransferase